MILSGFLISETVSMDNVRFLHVVVDLSPLFLVHVGGTGVFTLPFCHQWVIVPAMAVHLVAVDDRVMDLLVLIRNGRLLLPLLLDGIFLGLELIGYPNLLSIGTC